MLLLRRHLFIGLFIGFVRTISQNIGINMEDLKKLPPPLSKDKHKGQAGRIGVFGGSLEYTGAPYFAGISSLKTGADLAYIFCMKEAAPVIKSYSPELIVLPFLDHEDALGNINPWIDRLSVILIGPGLGREPLTLSTIKEVISLCRTKNKPLVIDADGLFLIAQDWNIIKDYPQPIILTPNAMEFERLVRNDFKNESKLERAKEFFQTVGGDVILLCKGEVDEIVTKKSNFKFSPGGSGRRCGGQGDLLAGSLATFFSWSFLNPSLENPKIIACHAAILLTRKCNERAFGKLGRSMTCTDMIQEIHGVFENYFESTPKTK